jgi:hypothetical protein
MIAQGFDSIIAQLEQQKAAIDKAFAALREVNATPVIFRWKYKMDVSIG